MNRIFHYSDALGLIFLLLLGCQESNVDRVTSGTITVAIDRSISQAIEPVLEKFQTLYPNAHVNILHTSSREAVLMLGQKKVQIAFIAREILPEEDQAFKNTSDLLRKYKIAVHGFAVNTHGSQPLRTVTLSSLRKIFHGEISNWSELGGSNASIIVAMTGPNSAAYIALQEMQLFTSLACKYILLESNNSLDSLQQKNKNVITIKPLLWQQSDTAFSRPVEILTPIKEDTTGKEYAISLHLANIYRERYPLRSFVYALTLNENVDLSTGIVSFIISGPGQKQLLNNGLVPATMPVRIVQFGS